MIESALFLKQYAHVGVYLVYGIFFASFSLFLAWLLRTRGNDPLLSTTYECGPDAIGSAWGQINVRFYVFGLLFVLFDVETLFIFPWAVAFRSLGIIGFVEMLAFVGVLFLGLVYAWRKGALEWH